MIVIVLRSGQFTFRQQAVKQKILERTVSKHSRIEIALHLSWLAGSVCYCWSQVYKTCNISEGFVRYRPIYFVVLSYIAVTLASANTSTVTLLW